MRGSYKWDVELGEFGHRFQKEQVLAFSSVAAPEKAARSGGLDLDGALSA